MKYLIFFLVTFTIVSCQRSNDDNGQVFCTDEFVYGLNVVVRDAVSLVVLTDQEVTVTAVDGAYSEDLLFSSVSFLGAGERPGNYVLIASGAGYQTYTSATVSIGMDDDDCHVIPQAIEILIQPN